ncbi:MAG: hypothetical protein L0322_14310 [Chloroflexi bacterium]|nr:hypothetical protein [Chloroflexota bacterium]
MEDPQFVTKNRGLSLAEALMSVVLVGVVEIIHTQSVPSMGVLGGGQALFLWVFFLVLWRLSQPAVAWLGDRLFWLLLSVLTGPEEPPVMVLEVVPPWLAEPPQPAPAADEWTFFDGEEDDFLATNDGSEPWTA